MTRFAAAFVTLALGVAGCGGESSAPALSTPGAGGTSGVGGTSAAGGTSAVGGTSAAGGQGGAGGTLGLAGAGGTATSGSGGASGASGQAGASGGGVTVHLRLLTGNLSSGNNQNWDGGEGLRIVQGLHPDVAMLQELTVGDGSDATLAAFAETAMGPGTQAYRETGAMLPNAILSRYPILDQGTWVDPKVTNRSFAWARIGLPSGTDLVAVSVHLLTTNPTDRAAEATSLVGYLNGVPGDARVVVGGDLNTATRDEPCIAAFSAALSTAAPYPADASGNDATSGPRTKPHDWLLPDSLLRASEVPVVIGMQMFPAGLVFDSRVYTPIEDVAPAMVGDSGASGMQHMAVVRDFIVSP